MKNQKWLRGDPKRPFPTDLKLLNELEEKMVSPSHEPEFFGVNKGTMTLKQARSRNYQSIENIEVMSEMGLHMPRRAHFFKGAGLKMEKDSIQKTVKYAKELHARGMLVSVYVGGTMFTDYFFKEVPEAVNWLRKDQDGNPITYSHFQLQRFFPCLNNPDYRAYTKKVLDIAVQEIEADEIFFDNQILRHEPRSCRCLLCIKHLREMIRRKYTRAQCEERYGFPEYPDVFPPIWSQANPPWRLDVIRSPQIQDWIDHRISTVIEFYQDMAQHVKRQKSDTAVGLNIKGIHGHNRAFNHGICHSSASNILDFSCIDGYDPGYEDGVIESEVRFYKSSVYTNIAVVDNNKNELVTAEGQVYGQKKFIKDHGWIGDMGNCTVYTPMTQFMRGNLDLYHERDRVHDIAVFRSKSSTNYCNHQVHEQLIPFEETLAVEKFPWTIIFDHNIAIINRFRIIALPEIQAVSNTWMDRLTDFMMAGGAVIASGKACAFDDWYRPRKDGVGRWLGHPPSGKYEVAKVGKGKFVYVPEWDVVMKWSNKDWFQIGGKGCVPVKNRKVFLKAIADATVGAPLTFHVTGNDRVFAEAIASREGPQEGIDLHIINYDSTHLKPKMKVSVALPTGKKSAEVTLIDPHKTPHKKWKVKTTTAKGLINFQMFTPKVYGLAQIKFK
jgi:hypothetical protein